MDNQENGSNTDKNLAIVFLLLQILFVIIGVISLRILFVDNRIDMDIFSERDGISIEGLSEAMPGALASDAKVLETELLDAVSQNVSDIHLGESQAIIREGSIKTHYYETLDINYFSAIVDIPQLHQSYWLFHEYSDNAEKPNLSINDRYVVLCLIDQSQIIYPEFDCKSSYNSLTYNSIAKHYLEPLSNEDFGFFEMDNDDYHDVTILRRNKAKSNDELIQEAKDLVTSLGIPPSIFKYKVLEQEDAYIIQYEE